MKRFTLFLIIFIQSFATVLCLESLFDGLEYYRVTCNYNGTAFNGKTILAYGEAGIIVRSDDMGNTWEQINLDDRYNILSLTNIGGNFYGVNDKQYIIKSTTNGKDWQLFDFGENTRFIKISSYKSNLICLTTSRFFVLNENIQVLKEYQINTDSVNIDFSISGSNLVYSSGKGLLGVINLDNENQYTVNLEDLGLCTDCPVPTHLFSDESHVYFNLNNDLYKFNFVTVVRVFNSANSGVYTSNGKDIFQIYNNIFIKDAINKSNLDSLYFIKVDQSSKRAISIKSPGSDRYVSQLKFNSIKFLNSDLIVAVGNDKLIYMSTNGGKDWNLKSHYNPLYDWGKIFILDALHAFTTGVYMKFISTKDGGVTWLPQKNYAPAFSKMAFVYLETSFFSDNKNGFVYFPTMYQNDTSFGYTNDGCETVNLRYNNDIAGILGGGERFVNTTYGNTILSHSAGTPFGLIFTKLFRFDEKLNIINYSVIDSMDIVYASDIDEKELFAMTCNYRYPRKIGHRWHWDSINYSLIISRDTGITWQVEYNFDLPGLDWNNVGQTESFFYQITSVGDNLYIPYTYKSDSTGSILKVYKLNIKTKKLELLMDKKSAITSIYGYRDKVFIIHIKDNDILLNDDIENNPTVWRKVGPYTRYSDLRLFPQKENMIYIQGYDSLFKSKVIWFAKPKNIDDVVEIEKESNNQIALSNPSPNPAVNHVKTRLYWDKYLNIENASFEVYSVLGLLVSDRNQFYFDKINSYTGDLTWNNDTLPDGVYLIVFKLDNNIRSVPVVISK